MLFSLRMSYPTLADYSLKEMMELTESRHAGTAVITNSGSTPSGNDALAAGRGVEEVIQKAKTRAAADPQFAAISDEAQWVKESFQAAQTRAYISPIGVGPGPYTLDDTYKSAAEQFAAQRTALAGVRLATLLNEF